MCQPACVVHDMDDNDSSSAAAWLLQALHISARLPAYCCANDQLQTPSAKCFAASTVAFPEDHPASYRAAYTVAVAGFIEVAPADLQSAASALSETYKTQARLACRLPA